MSAILSIVAFLFALAIFVPAAFYALEVALAFAGPRRAAPGHGEPLAIIVPAHDEEAVIGATLANIAERKRPEDRVLVVADNCSDDTAKIARDAGADVLIRTDTARRGKGFALQFGIDSLKAAPPTGVVVIDADCRLHEGAIERIAAEIAATGRPAQMLCLMRAPEGAPARRRIAAFAWILINKVRMRGLQRLSGGARLTGAGMALPWRVAERINLASGEIVEDLALSIKLAAQGDAPTLVEDAVVESVFPVADAGAVTQRARWENGSLRLALTIAPGMLLQSLMKGDFRLACAALDLATPPLTVLAALICASAIAAFIPLLWGDATALALALGAGALFFGATVTAWVAFGREALPMRDVFALLGYLGDKARIYRGEGRRSAETWTRTARERAAPDEPGA